MQVLVRRSALGQMAATGHPVALMASEPRLTPATVGPRKERLVFGGGLEGPGLLIILAMVLLLFGGSKLPGLARGLGQARHEFEKASGGDPAPKNVVAPDVVTMTKSEYDALLAARSAPSSSADPSSAAPASS